MFRKEEHLTRIKSDGVKRKQSGRVLLNGIDEVLHSASLSADQPDAGVLSRMDFPVSCYRKTT